MSSASVVPHVVVLGSGQVGLSMARRLYDLVEASEVRLTLVDQSPHSVYQPLLFDVFSGVLSEHSVMIDVTQSVASAQVICSSVVSVDHERKVVALRSGSGSLYELAYDVLVCALGSVPASSASSSMWSFHSLDDALMLRERIVERVRVAVAATSSAQRLQALSFVFVGAGATGVELVAACVDLVSELLEGSSVPLSDARFVLVDSASRILPNFSTSLAHEVSHILRSRRVDVRLGVTLASWEDGRVCLSDGSVLSSDTVVSTVGVRPSPVVASFPFLLDSRGRLVCDPFLRLSSSAGVVLDGVFAAGDCAAVPDLASPLSWCAPSAQHAVRQGSVVAENVAAFLLSRPLREYYHQDLGSMSVLGPFNGAAEILGVPITGPVAWVLSRVYHSAQFPSSAQRLSVLARLAHGALAHGVLAHGVLDHGVLAHGVLDHGVRVQRGLFEGVLNVLRDLEGRYRRDVADELTVLAQEMDLY